MKPQMLSGLGSEHRSGKKRKAWVRSEPSVLPIDKCPPRPLSVDTAVVRIYNQLHGVSHILKRQTHNGNPAANADRKKLLDASALAATGRYALTISFLGQSILAEIAYSTR